MDVVLLVTREWCTAGGLVVSLSCAWTWEWWAQVLPSWDRHVLWERGGQDAGRCHGEHESVRANRGVRAHLAVRERDERRHLQPVQNHHRADHNPRVPAVGSPPLDARIYGPHGRVPQGGQAGVLGRFCPRPGQRPECVLPDAERVQDWQADHHRRHRVAFTPLFSSIALHYSLAPPRLTYDHGNELYGRTLFWPMTTETSFLVAFYFST